MRSVRSDRGSWFLTFDRGDEFVETLQRFAKEHRLHGAHFSGIGAFERTTIAWWDPDAKHYEKHDIHEQLEVLSVTGDTALYEGDVRIHAHVVLGRRDLSVIGGHLFSGIVHPTLELYVDDDGLTLKRRLDPSSRLPLIDL